MAHFTFDRQQGRFTLASVHPGHSVREVVDNTGFQFDLPASVPETAAPPQHWLDQLHGPVREKVAQTYPQFAASRLGGG